MKLEDFTKFAGHAEQWIGKTIQNVSAHLADRLSILFTDGTSASILCWITEEGDAQSTVEEAGAYSLLALGVMDEQQFDEYCALEVKQRKEQAEQKERELYEQLKKKYG